jgi:hypothetical protein
MMTFSEVIDTVQNSKKTWVKTFVTNEKVAEALNGFVDAQTEYTKNAVKVGTETASVVAAEALKAVKEAGKFDYTKFGEGIMKAYSAQSKK